MDTYQVKFLSGGKLLQTFGWLDCQDDIAALEIVQGMLRGLCAEIWRNGRPLCRINSDGTSRADESPYSVHGEAARS